jgi:hypothetical protein
VKRREFIAIIGSAGLWPLAAFAQEPIPVVGFLNNATPEAYAPFVAAFKKGLAQAGYVDGQNVAIEYRWGHFAASQSSNLANELVQRKASVLVASGGDRIIQAARAATTTVPIVVLVGNDPVETGLVQSVKKPGGNITGVSVFAVQLEFRSGWNWLASWQRTRRQSHFWKIRRIRTQKLIGMSLWRPRRKYVSLLQLSPLRPRRRLTRLLSIWPSVKWAL